MVCFIAATTITQLKHQCSTAFEEATFWYDVRMIQSRVTRHHWGILLKPLEVRILYIRYQRIEGTEGPNQEVSG